MSNPELAAGFSNPKVQAAIMDISQNPMNVVKYNDQPEVGFSVGAYAKQMPKIDQGGVAT
eukprot:1149883-Pelagomonas_calceolata.AAC.6